METERFKCDDIFLSMRMLKEDCEKIVKKIEIEEINFEMALWTHFLQMTLREIVTLQVIFENKLTLDRSETLILKNINILMEEIKKTSKE